MVYYTFMLRNESKRNKLCKHCPLAQVASLVGDTWILLIVRDLLQKECRFKDLLDSLDGISSRTLTNKLQTLETEGVILRNDLGGSPPRVEYRLTQKGKKLAIITNAMREYGKKYL